MFSSLGALYPVQALPQWAQAALQQHEGDAREIKTLEQLESGTTGDAIWDAMQHQLMTNGALCFAHLSCACQLLPNVD